MSAIAGLASARSTSDRETRTRAFLEAQRVYGSHRSHYESVDGATFGISPWGARTAVPAVSDSGVLLVADLRLDNREELIERLGRAFRRSSDTELLLAAWLEAGHECLSWIAGDFAVAVFESKSRVLTLARDPTGQMPLHYSLKGEEFAFATMPSGLKPFVGRLTVDRLTLAATVCNLNDARPSSHFEQVSRVLPGEIVRLGPRGIDRRIYWTPRTVYDSPAGVGLVEEFRHVLDFAVADRLKDCARPIATHLSSGYDSSAVTATAAQLVENPDQIIAFTSAPAKAAPIAPGLWRIGDESEVAAATASALGIRHVVVREMPDMRSVIRRQSLLFQEAFVSVPNIAWLLQIRRQAAAAGADCILSGDCGNVTLNAGGLYVLAEWIRQHRWFTWMQQARHAAQRPDTHWRGVLFNSFRPWIPGVVSDLLQNQYLRAGASNFAPFLRREWKSRALRSSVREPRFSNGYDERAHWILSSNVGMLRKGALAGEGIDERDPLADRRLIEFSLKIPPGDLYWNGVSRPLARAALADRVPKSVINLKVRGLQAADWAMRFTQADALEILEEISVSDTVQDLFDLGWMKRAIDRWPVENWNDRSVQYIYRGSLIGALSSGMFALVHEQGTSAAELL